MVRLRTSMSTPLRLGILGCLAMVLGGALTPPPAAASESTQPILAYAFDEGSGTTASDLYGTHEATVEGARWAEGKYGTALRFSGQATECVQTPEAADLQLSEHFTIEAWIRPEGPESFQEAIIFKEGSGAGVAGYGLKIGQFTKGRLDGFIGKEERNPYRVEDTTTLPVRRWSHVALTFDGSKMRLYVNGGLVGEAASAAVKPTSGPLSIGCSKELSEGFIGKVDEVRIYNRALSATEIAVDRDTPILTAPSTEPVAGWLFDEGEGTAAGDHVRGHVGTVENATWTEGKYGKALRFNGTNSCVTVPFAPDLELTENLTIEAWVRPEGARVNKVAVATMEDPAPAIATEEPILFYLHGGGHLRPSGDLRNGEKSGFVGVSGKENLAENAWSHVAFTDDGTNLRFYVNGVLQGTYPAPQMWPATGPFRIGCSHAFLGNYFEGSIDDVLLYNRALPVGQIEADEHNDFTPPRIELTGALTEGLKTGTTEYPLHVHAVDGEAGFPGVGVKSVAISVDGNVVDQVEQECKLGNCTLDADWTFNSQAFPGEHDVTVSASDQAGNSSSKTLELALPDGSMQACMPLNGTNTYAPTETVSLPFGGSMEVYDGAEGTYEFPNPPASFSPFTASNSELEEFGFPVKPAAGEAEQLAEWEEVMSGYSGVSPGGACTSPSSRIAGGAGESGSSEQTLTNYSGFRTWEESGKNVWKGVKAWHVVAEKNPNTCSNDAIDQWVGLGGKEHGALIQGGSKVNAGGYFHAFINRFPAGGPTPPDHVVRMEVEPGDRFYAKLEWLPNREMARVFFKDKRTGKVRPVLMKSINSSFFDGSVGEFIDERPEHTETGEHFSLYNYHLDEWSRAQVETLAGQWKKLGEQPRRRVTMQEEGKVLSEPGGLRQDGMSFMDHWRHCR
jgi:hypothetical protein